MNKYKNIIIKVLAISEMEYAELVYNYANIWMKRFFGDSSLIIYGLEHSPLFWKWWLNQWNNRDIEFIRLTGFDNNTFIIDTETLEITREIYKDHHNAYDLIIHPNKFIISEASKIMNGVNEQNKKQKHKAKSKSKT